jgi:hypothetical protein
MIIDNEQKVSISTVLRESRREGLKLFLSYLMPLLQKEGFSIEDFLLAIASWVCEQETFTDSVVCYLENAATELKVPRR